MTIKLAILDLGIGNINSVLNACSYLGQTADIISNKHLVNKYSHIILPGVGSFGSGCSSLTPKLREYILAHIQEKFKV